MASHTTADPAADDQFDAIRVIARNALLGMVIAFVITVAVSMVAGQDFVNAAAIASMPALFAGPFVAGLLTVVEYQRFEDRHGGAH